MSIAPQSVLASSLNLIRATPETVTRSVPNLVKAQSLQNLEIARLMKDPMFGDINKGKIMQAEKIIREHRIEQEPQQMKARKEFKMKIK